MCSARALKVLGILIKNSVYILSILLYLFLSSKPARFCLRGSISSDKAILSCFLFLHSFNKCLLYIHSSLVLHMLCGCDSDPRLVSSGNHHLVVEVDVDVIKGVLKTNLKTPGPAVGIRKNLMEEVAFDRWALKGEQGED